MADVASAIKAGFYTVGLAGGVEAMSQTPMAWEGGVNPKIGNNKKAQSCLMPMGEPRNLFCCVKMHSVADFSAHMIYRSAQVVCSCWILLPRKA